MSFLEGNSPPSKPSAIILKGATSGGWEVWAVYTNSGRAGARSPLGRRTLVAVLISLLGKELARQVAMTIAKGYGLAGFSEET
jgi:hypothetical protein